MNDMNPLEMLKMINNPEQFVLNYIKRNNNPIMNNMFELAQKGDKEQLVKIARNIFKEKGVDFDKEIMPLINLKK